MQDLRTEVAMRTDAYPWREITASILDEPVPTDRLLQQGLRAQRDWVIRGGRERPRPSVRQSGKRTLAFLLSRLIFGAIYTVVLVMLLVLLKANWPSFDIYVILDALRSIAPGMFGEG